MLELINPPSTLNEVLLICIDFSLIVIFICAELINSFLILLKFILRFPFKFPNKFEL